MAKMVDYEALKAKIEARLEDLDSLLTSAYASADTIPSLILRYRIEELRAANDLIDDYVINTDKE